MSDTLTMLACTVDETGIHAPTFDQIQEWLKAQYRSIYGQDIYLEADSQDGQLIGIFARALDDANSMAIAVYNSYSPATAQGVGLSTAVKINGIARLVASTSTVDLLVTGQAGTVISNGQAASDAGVKWNLPAIVTIPITGEITVTATAAVAGSTQAEPNTITSIVTPTRGWQSVTNPTAANPGSPVEDDAALRQRQAVSTALPSLTVLDGIVGAVASITGVTRYRAYENDTNATDGDGIPGHTICLVVDGGNAQTIGNTIGLKKAPGVGTYGTTTVVYTDYIGIDHDVHFYRPTDVAITVEIAIDALHGYTSVIGNRIKAAVVAYINALQIGDDVIWSKLFVPANLNNDSDGRTFDITSVQLSRDGAPVSPEDVVIAFNEAPTCVLDDVSLIVNP